MLAQVAAVFSTHGAALDELGFVGSDVLGAAAPAAEAEAEAEAKAEETSLAVFEGSKLAINYAALVPLAAAAETQLQTARRMEFDAQGERSGGRRAAGLAQSWDFAAQLLC